MSNFITSKYKLSGLSCQACEKLVTKRVSTLPGVQNVYVHLSDQTVLIEGEREIEQEELSKILENTDYKVVNKIFVIPATEPESI